MSSMGVCKYLKYAGLIDQVCVEEARAGDAGVKVFAKAIVKIGGLRNSNWTWLSFRFEGGL